MVLQAKVEPAPHRAAVAARLEWAAPAVLAAQWAVLVARAAQWEALVVLAAQWEAPAEWEAVVDRAEA